MKNYLCLLTLLLSGQCLAEEAEQPRDTGLALRKGLSATIEFAAALTAGYFAYKLTKGIKAKINLPDEPTSNGMVPIMVRIVTIKDNPFFTSLLAVAGYKVLIAGWKSAKECIAELEKPAVVESD